jgi:topoisomerase-4 subunit A
MLLAHTSLESSASINLVMIGGDGRPRQKGCSISSASGLHSVSTVTRRTQFRLKKSMTASIFSKVAKQFY